MFSIGLSVSVSLFSKFLFLLILENFGQTLLLSGQLTRQSYSHSRKRRKAQFRNFKNYKETCYFSIAACNCPDVLTLVTMVSMEVQ